MPHCSPILSTPEGLSLPLTYLPVYPYTAPQNPPSVLWEVLIMPGWNTSGPSSNHFRIVQKETKINRQNQPKWKNIVYFNIFKSYQLKNNDNTEIDDLRFVILAKVRKLLCPILVMWHRHHRLPTSSYNNLTICTKNLKRVHPFFFFKSSSF